MTDLIVRDLGLQAYEPVWQAMQNFTNRRDEYSTDEVWLLQHRPVFTQGQAGKAEHVLVAGDIPVVQTDRGGQVTYHGPGQLIAYLLLDIKRRKLGVRQLITHIEQAIVSLLGKQYGISAYPRADAPGVYVEGGAKIAQLGLRVRHGRTFHGLSLNVDMNLEPFQRINPCGHAGLAVTCIRDEYGQSPIMGSVQDQLVSELLAELGYTRQQLTKELPVDL